MTNCCDHFLADGTKTRVLGEKAKIFYEHLFVFHIRKGERAISKDDPHLDFTPMMNQWENTPNLWLLNWGKTVRFMNQLFSVFLEGRRWVMSDRYSVGYSSRQTNCFMAFGALGKDTDRHQIVNSYWVFMNGHSFDGWRKNMQIDFWTFVAFCFCVVMFNERLVFCQTNKQHQNWCFQKANTILNMSSFILTLIKTNLCHEPKVFSKNSCFQWPFSL